MKKTHAQFKRELWKWFTLYIKQRDGYRCVTCGRQVAGANAQGGHYIAKAACSLDYYFSEVNVATQCAACNLFLEGNRPAFRQFILHRYGPDALADLERNFRKPCKWTAQEFEQKIAHYKALVT